MSLADIRTARLYIPTLVKTCMIYLIFHCCHTLQFETLAGFGDPGNCLSCHLFHLCYISILPILPIFTSLSFLSSSPFVFPQTPFPFPFPIHTYRPPLPPTSSLFYFFLHINTISQWLLLHSNAPSTPAPSSPPLTLPSCVFWKTTPWLLMRGGGLWICAIGG